MLKVRFPGNAQTYKSYKNQIKSNQIKSLLLSHHHSTSALVSEILMSVLQTVQKNNKQFTYGQTVQKNNRQFTYGQTVQKNNRQFTYGQTVQKNNKQFTYGQTVQKKQQTIYIWTDSAKKTTNNLHMDRQCKKKLHWSIYSAPDSAKKTTAIYIWTDSAKKQQQFTYGQTVQKNNKQFTYGQTVQKKKKTIYIWTDSAKKTTNNLHMDRQCKKNCTGAFTVLQTVQKKQQQFTYGQTVQKNNSNLHIVNGFTEIHLQIYRNITWNPLFYA